MSDLLLPGRLGTHRNRVEDELVCRWRLRVASLGGLAFFFKSPGPWKNLYSAIHRTQSLLPQNRFYNFQILAKIALTNAWLEGYPCFGDVTVQSSWDGSWQWKPSAPWDFPWKWLGHILGTVGMHGVTYDPGRHTTWISLLCFLVGHSNVVSSYTVGVYLRVS